MSQQITLLHVHCDKDTPISNASAKGYQDKPFNAVHIGTMTLFLNDDVVYRLLAVLVEMTKPIPEEKVEEPKKLLIDILKEPNGDDNPVNF